MASISRKEYAQAYGPTTGDKVRLGDTSLLAEVEHDHTVYGEECKVGVGKTLRDGMGFAASADAAGGALDIIVENALLIDPVQGIVKCDIGIRNGQFAGIGKGGNPTIMAGVDSHMVCGPGTKVINGAGLIATPGGIDVHTHYISPNQCENALSTGLTTMIGSCLGPFFAIDSGGPNHLHRMLQAAEAFPLNFGFFGNGSTHKPHPIVEHMAAGAIGVKIHEDYGAMPATIDCALTVADEYDFQVQLHTDTLNEAGYFESTMDAIAGRTIHMYHTEGAGGGHAPDIIRCNGEPNCLPSSTNPTNPYTVNAFDEHLDMVMTAHQMNPNVPSDVLLAESRVRGQTMGAEDVLHDLGAISMFGSDSQGMGRINEVISRCWQLASKMKDQRGRLPEDTTADADNGRIMRYLAKYTINAARTFGIADHIGSVERGKMADLVLWRPGLFGMKPDLVVKGGFVTWGSTGDGAACLLTCEPRIERPQWGAFGLAAPAVSATFANRLSLEADVAGKLGLRKPMLLAYGTRKLTKHNMLHNNACPHIEVNPETFDVYADGALAMCDPISSVTMGQKYFLR